MKKRGNTNAASTIGFVTMLTITFVIMKLAGGISWSWGWVLAPVWISAIFVGLILLITLTVIISRERGHKGGAKVNTVEKIRIVLDEGAKMPTRAHAWDAGMDLYAISGAIIPAKEDATFDTGVHIEIPAGYWGKLESKSGLNVKHRIVSCGGTIDAGYTGSIKVRLYNLGGFDYVVQPGDKICQLVITPCITPGLELVDTLTETERGANGFGSSGR